MRRSRNKTETAATTVIEGGMWKSAAALTIRSFSTDGSDSSRVLQRSQGYTANHYTSWTHLCEIRECTINHPTKTVASAWSPTVILLKCEVYLDLLTQFRLFAINPRDLQQFLPCRVRLGKIPYLTRSIGRLSKTYALTLRRSTLGSGTFDRLTHHVSLWGSRYL